MNESKYHIGGSDSPVILGVSPFASPRDLWLRKKGLIEPQPQTNAMKRGTYLEPVAAELYSEITGRKVRRVRAQVEDRQRPWMTGHIDRLVNAEDDRGPGILEVKCPGLTVFSKCKREGLPLHYSVQLQHYLGITRKKWGAFVVFSSELWEMLHFDVKSDEELFQKIVDYDFDFLLSLDGDTPPDEEQPIIDLPFTSSNIVKIETPEWAEAVRALRTAGEIADEAEALELEAKERILRLSGAAEVAEGAGVRIYYKWQEGRRTLDRAKFRWEHPEIHLENYEKQGSPFRAFRPYFLKPKGGIE